MSRYSPTDTVTALVLQSIKTDIARGEDVSAALTCRCGRPRDEIHCPCCGAKNRYALASKAGMQLMPDGRQALGRAYKCRGCGLAYTDVDWLFHCEAPPKSKSMIDVRKEDKALEALQQLRAKQLAKPDGKIEVITDLFKGKTRADLRRHVPGTPIVPENLAVSTDDYENIPRASDDKGASPLDQNPFADDNDEGNPVGDGE